MKAIGAKPISAATPTAIPSDPQKRLSSPVRIAQRPVYMRAMTSARSPARPLNWPILIRFESVIALEALSSSVFFSSQACSEVVPAPAGKSLAKLSAPLSLLSEVHFSFASFGESVSFALPSR